VRLVFVWFLVCMSGVAAQSPPAPPAWPRPPQAPLPVSHSTWHTDYDTAIAEAKATGKLLIVDFYKVPCLPCERLDAVFRSPQVAELLKNYVCVKVREGELSDRVGVHQFPTVIICDGGGTIYREDVGAVSVETMVERLKAPKVLRQAYVPTVFERPTVFLTTNCGPRG